MTLKCLTDISKCVKGIVDAPGKFLSDLDRISDALDMDEKPKIPGIPKKNGKLAEPFCPYKVEKNTS